jgi:hypothetical protein
MHPRSRSHLINFMELLIKVIFWLGLFNCTLRLIIISLTDYPRVTKDTLGGDLVKLIEQAVFVIWAAVLLFVL